MWHVLERGHVGAPHGAWCRWGGAALGERSEREPVVTPELVREPLLKIGVFTEFENSDMLN